MKNRTYEIIRECINDYFGRNVGVDEKLDFQYMSTVAELLILLEEKLHVTFDIIQIDINKINTVNKLTSYVEDRFTVYEE